VVILEDTHTVYLALGTNLGDRLENLRQARAALAPHIRVEACSPIYETPPWGYTDQPSFLNQVLRGHTQLQPLQLLESLKQIEANLGRQVTLANGPRIIDLDILFYDDLVLQLPDLTIPHPRMTGRVFVWLPLSVLAPDFCHPVLGQTASQVIAGLDVGDIKMVSDACMESASPVDE